MKGPKTGAVKASFRGCMQFDASQFSQANCSLLVSVGQKYHEDEKLAATVELIRGRFKKCVINLADGLQRHNNHLFDPHLSEEESMAKSVREGDDWLSRNRSIYEGLDMPYEVVRWNHWLSHERYCDCRAKIEELYSSNRECQMAYEHSIREFLTRFEKRCHGSVDKSKYFKACLEYLKEECSAMMLYPEEAIHFEIYPNPRTFVLSFIYERLIAPVFPNLLRPLALRFKRYSVPPFLVREEKESVLV